jgi:hypothetical protein
LRMPTARYTAVCRLALPPDQTAAGGRGESVDKK